MEISQGKTIKLMIGLVCEKEGEVNGDSDFWLRQLVPLTWEFGKITRDKLRLRLVLAVPMEYIT